MTSNEIDTWLDSIGKDRPWLADKLGISMGTLYNGFSKGFAARSIKGIKELMNDAGTNSGGIEVTFTAREFERIEQARKLLGIATRKLYYEEAIAEYTDKVLADEEAGKTTQGQNISHFPAQQQSTLAAEEPARYDSSSTPKKKPAKNGTED